MSANTAPDRPNPAPGLHPDFALQLPADAYYHLVRTLRLTLPPPPADTPEDLARRDHAAIARVAALAPANAAEADVAAQVVAAAEQWKECLRLAQLPETAPEWAMKCRAQALAMMRQANGALRLLLRLQQARRKLDADTTAADRAAWREHCALGLMAEALAGERPPPAIAEPAESPAPEPQPIPEAGAEPVAEPAPDPVGAAEEYALTHPERAALIRQTAWLPENVSSGPPDADVVQAPVGMAVRDRACPAARAA